ncbi:probable CCR4-associated factor 1 homolog 11 [Aristolochia californica]|uniref:probable CCR4-associated factor 1 homolog 11 n=1 Tax=Aristolochia californica TaxID=171875 RepID=UPI0035E24043
MPSSENVISVEELFSGQIRHSLQLHDSNRCLRCREWRSPSVRERNHPQVRYQVLKLNVDTLKLIQLGHTLCDADGNLPHLGTNCRYAWEFNFSDFDRNWREGISSLHFADFMFSSGLVGNGGVHWVSFHGSYDFGYLVKILTQSSLPELLTDFMELLTALFGSSLFDVKYMGSKRKLNGGLERQAALLQVELAAGNAHQDWLRQSSHLPNFLKMSQKFGRRLTTSLELYMG